MTDILIKLTGFHKSSAQTHVFEYKEELGSHIKDVDSHIENVRNEYDELLFEGLQRENRVVFQFGNFTIVLSDYSWFSASVSVS